MEITEITNDDQLKQAKQRMQILEENDQIQARTEEYERLLTLIEAYENKRNTSTPPPQE